MRVIGIDPGLRNMGWGLIDVKQAALLMLQMVFADQKA